MSILRRFLAWAKQVNWDTEPVVIMGIIKAVLAALAGAGLTVSDHQVAAITAYVTAACLILATVITRGKVTSPATVAARQAGTDAHLAAASEALANAGPAIQNRARLCPTLPAATFAGGSYTPQETDPVTSFDPPRVIGTHPSKRLGRRPPKNAPALRFADHLAVVPPHPIADPPPGLSWPMDHNDRVGCCVVAGLDHFRQVVETLLTGTYKGWTDAELLALYQTQNPGFKSWADAGGADDGGMDIQTLLELLVKRGEILGFAKVDHTNIDEVKAATDLDLGLVTGETLTRRNMSEQIWDYHASDPVEGGHCTVSVGYDPLEDQVSWGAIYKMTDAFFQKRVEEAWFIITQAHVDHPGFRAGFDLTSFAAAYKQMTGRDFPAVVPAPTPAPVPTPPPAPAPGPDAGFPAAVAVYAGLADWLAARAEKKGMTPNAYAAWVLAGEAHKR